MLEKVFVIVVVAKTGKSGCFASQKLLSRGDMPNALHMIQSILITMLGSWDPRRLPFRS